MFTRDDQFNQTSLAPVTQFSFEKSSKLFGVGFGAGKFDNLCPRWSYDLLMIDPKPAKGGSIE